MVCMVSPSLEIGNEEERGVRLKGREAINEFCL